MCIVSMHIMPHFIQRICASESSVFLRDPGISTPPPRKFGEVTTMFSFLMTDLDPDVSWLPCPLKYHVSTFT